MRKVTSHLSGPEIRVSREKVKTLMEVDYA
jgi:hypothetical protein